LDAHKLIRQLADITYNTIYRHTGCQGRITSM